MICPKFLTCRIVGLDKWMTWLKFVKFTKLPSSSSPFLFSLLFHVSIFFLSPLFSPQNCKLTVEGKGLMSQQWRWYVSWLGFPLQGMERVFLACIVSHAWGYMLWATSFHPMKKNCARFYSKVWKYNFPNQARRANQ